MLYYVIATLFVINCFVLLLVVLIQTGKAGDIASAFGGGSSQAAFGARSGATLLTKVTWVSAVIFFVGALALSMISRGPGSVVGAVPAPVQAPAPTGTPAQTDAPAEQQSAPAAHDAPAEAPAQPQQ
ncbi:MAG TPA: preprotein translocase subunit SecG [Vicinamibacterales bacterium]